MDPKNILNITPEQENVDLVHNPKLIGSGFVVFKFGYGQGD